MMIYDKLNDTHNNNYYKVILIKIIKDILFDLVF